MKVAFAHLSGCTWRSLSLEHKETAAPRIRFAIYTALALSLGAVGTRQKHHPVVVKLMNKKFKPQDDGQFFIVG